MNPIKLSAKLTHYIFNQGQDNQSEILELKNESKESKGVIITLHGMQFGPKTIGGWETLKIMSQYVLDNGYTALMPSVLGFGKTEGDRDFSGPKSVERLIESLELWKEQNNFDGKFIIMGSSRGGTLAVLTSIEKPELFSHVISAPGSYDLEKEYNSITDERKKQNIEDESGTTQEDFDIRSATKQIDKIKNPILIIHGDQDEEIDVEQAKEFDKLLTENNKEHQTVILEGKGHRILSKDLFSETIVPFVKLNS